MLVKAVGNHGAKVKIGRSTQRISRIQPDMLTPRYTTTKHDIIGLGCKRIVSRP